MATQQATVFMEDHNHNDAHTMDDDPALLPGPSALPSETSTQVRVDASHDVRASRTYWLALARGAYPHAAGFAYWERGGAYVDDVGLGL